MLDASLLLISIIQIIVVFDLISSRVAPAAADKTRNKEFLMHKKAIIKATVDSVMLF